MATASAVQIVPPGVDTIGYLTFTPDGNYFDYWSIGTNDVNGKLYQIPTLGGTPRLLLDPADTRVSFSPDGRQMAYAIFDLSSNEGRLMLANADGSETKVLAVRKVSGTSQGGEYWGAYVDVQWSPDGRHIAALINDRDPAGQNSKGSQIAQDFLSTAQGLAVL
jgi:Tol biopolymer transport system component